MIFTTGDEVGLIKSLQFNPLTSVPNPSKKLKKEQTLVEHVKSIGKIDRKLAIQAMTYDQTDIVIARANGMVERIDGDKYQVFEEKETQKFIGIDVRDGVTITCTNTGRVHYSSGKVFELEVADLEVMKVHATNSSIIATVLAF